MACHYPRQGPDGPVPLGDMVGEDFAQDIQARAAGFLDFNDWVDQNGLEKPAVLACGAGFLNRRSGFPDLPKFGPEISQNDQSQTTLDPCFVTLKDPYKRFTSECIHMPEGTDLEQVASRLDGLVIDQCTTITLPPETCKSTLKEMK